MNARCRVVALSVAACAVVALATLPSAAAPAPGTFAPVRSSALVEPFTVRGYHVWFGVDRSRTDLPGIAEVCASAAADVVRGNARVRYEETACELGSSYTFDVVDGVAAFTGSVRSELLVERYVRRKGVWRFVSQTITPSTVRADLRWVGVGEESTSPAVGLPGAHVCPGRPCVAPPWVGVVRQRRADVVGTLRFDGARLTAPISRADGGRMLWAS